MRKIGLLSAAALLLSAVPALAQVRSDIVRVPGVSFQPTVAPAQAAPAERGGFTILVNGGLGFQNDSGLEKTSVGLAGINVGIGGFLTRKLALLGRYSGTSVTFDYEEPVIYQIKQVSGVIGATLQFWPSDRFILEGGGGYGFWNAPDLDLDDTGFGLILGVGAVVYKRGGHNLVVGFEYSNLYTDYEPVHTTVHNMGITFGYQFHR